MDNRLTTFPAAWTVALAISAASALAQPPAASVKANPLREAYYGDLHLHTSYSFDAYLMGTQVDPGEAYRFAKGEAVEYLGQRVRRRQPLDFMAVTDHAESLGAYNGLENPNSAASQSKVGQALRSALAATARPDEPASVARLHRVLAQLRDRGLDFDQLPADLRAQSAAAWQREIDFANHHYEPGKFTTFIAYEWGSSPNGSVLHRNVIFRGSTAPSPFSADDSQHPEDLWAWLEKIRQAGDEALAIPHNGNQSNGLMYDWVDSGGRAIDPTYATARRANEPLSEISQIKGTSETHPLLSPADEFADYEIFDSVPPRFSSPYHPPGSFLRDALSRGLLLQRRLGVNPFKYGFVGASDLHTGLSVSAQADYTGDEGFANLGANRVTKEQATAILAHRSEGIDFLKTNSGNLTGVWAESNTRESLYDALRRKEAFATSGTRLKFRFFGGWRFGERLPKQRDWIAAAYRTGVPMGGDLPVRPLGTEAPRFVIWAVKDPNGANLDRAQVIKVWEEDGQQKEKVFDAVWSDKRRPDPKTGRLPVIGNTVNLGTGAYSNSIGSVELAGTWKDPEFDPRCLAAYYLRVLEIPTPRWSTLLAIRNNLPLPQNIPTTEQQRGWSSPIWYSAPAETTQKRR